VGVFDPREADPLGALTVSVFPSLIDMSNL
jgi:hypothetical protein